MPTINMGTLKGFPYPPAMVRGRRGRPAPHANSRRDGERRAKRGLEWYPAQSLTSRIPSLMQSTRAIAGGARSEYLARE